MKINSIVLVDNQFHQRNRTIKKGKSHFVNIFMLIRWFLLKNRYHLKWRKTQKIFLY
jgi:hypothetical protein